MPNKDGTGPKGEGPKTGNQSGTCENAKPVRNGRERCGCNGRRGFQNRCRN